LEFPFDDGVALGAEDVGVGSDVFVEGVVLLDGFDGLFHGGFVLGCVCVLVDDAGFEYLMFGVFDGVQVLLLDHECEVFLRLFAAEVVGLFISSVFCELFG
jgi:hypothetical protein